MNWLEARFRRKFKPHGEDFLYQDANATVIFDREDVEILVADWRKYWLSPWLWGLLAAATAMTVARMSGALVAFDPYVIIFAPLTILGCLTCLGVSQRGPAEKAHTMPSIGPGNGRPEWLADLWWFGFSLFQLLQARWDGDGFDQFRYVFVLGVLICGGRLVLGLWRLRSNPSA